MSQDQPTESFDPRAADAPTVRFNQQSEPPEGPPPEKGRSRTLLIVLSIIGGLLLLAVVVLVTLLLARGTNGTGDVLPSASPSPSESVSPSPSASESPSPSPSPSASPSPSPSAQASPTFATFTAPSAAGCTSANPSSQITFTWSSSNATMAWFGVHTTNAKAAHYESVPTTTTYTFDYQCSVDSEFFTVTLEDASGNLTHKTVTVTKN